MSTDPLDRRTHVERINAPTPAPPIEGAKVEKVSRSEKAAPVVPKQIAPKVLPDELPRKDPPHDI